MVRDHCVPIYEADNLLNGYNTIDNEIIAKYLLFIIGIGVTTAALEAN